MANLSKRNPWAVEMQPLGVSQFYCIGAYPDEAEAQTQAEAARERTERTGHPVPVRVRNAYPTR